MGQETAALEEEKLKSELSIIRKDSLRAGERVNLDKQLQERASKKKSCGQPVTSKTCFECDLEGQETAALEEEKLKSELSIIRKDSLRAGERVNLDKQLQERASKKK
ncbi:hypothetical protein F2Q69_00002976 [Brassica cretica]|uniref:Uncharacterized protein n=1 Tax=Brassica cretica TaxID=69181 RepID=A0A8S9PF25_BRACR|nr:hypothetical protein F2Q69_00002976 [Brassica cretica]